MAHTAASTNPPLNVAIIGCGYWGKHYVRITHSLQETSCVLVCDPDQRALDKIKMIYPQVDTTTSIDKVCLSKDVDAVIVVVPAALHFEIANKCLAAGKHVLVEKPFTTTAEDGMKLQALAKEKHLTILVGHTFLYNNRIRKAKELISSGDVGTINTMYAQRTNLGPIRLDTSAVMDLAPHDISIFLYTLGGLMPLAVSAVGQSVLPTTPHVDVAFITLMYPGNILGHVHVSWNDPQKIRQLTFVGSKARLSIDDMNNSEPVRVFYKSVESQTPGNSDGTQRDFVFRDGDIISPVVHDVEPLTAQVQDFIGCIHSQGTPVASAELGIKVTKILNAVEKSIALGGQKVPV